MNILSTPTFVESPFIIMKVGEYTFGKYTQVGVGGYTKVTYPNYMKSINIVKVNGMVNTYTIRLDYAITQYDDPNKLDKIFSTISGTRKITLSYGDWASPSFIYREESAIITKITSNINLNNSVISYAINATSDSMLLNASRKDFDKITRQPSEVIEELLYNTDSGLLDIFTGMQDRQKVKRANLLCSGDKKVTIEAKRNVTYLEYLNYLVGCMVPQESEEEENSTTNTAYYLSIVDEVRNEFNGPYFKITKVYSDTRRYDPTTTYEIDVGYPSEYSNLVTGFSVNTDDSWSILYNYSQSTKNSDTSYLIDNNGQTIGVKMPDLAKSNTMNIVTQANKNWWSKMTQFPISATMTIKGLIRPAILMSQIHVNVFFYGQKHISSGLYIITKHEDIIDSTGYRTVLSLTRIGGDDIKDNGTNNGPSGGSGNGWRGGR